MLSSLFTSRSLHINYILYNYFQYNIQELLHKNDINVLDVQLVLDYEFSYHCLSFCSLILPALKTGLIEKSPKIWPVIQPFHLWIVGCQGVVQLGDVLLGFPLYVPMRLRLSSLFYSLKVPLRFEIKNTWLILLSHFIGWFLTGLCLCMAFKFSSISLINFFNSLLSVCLPVPGFQKLLNIFYVDTFEQRCQPTGMFVYLSQDSKNF